MTITLSSPANMNAAFNALPDGDTKEYGLSLVKLATWMATAEVDGDIRVARYDGINLKIEVHGDPPDRFYVIRDDGGVWYWDVADQQMRSAARQFEAGKTPEQLRDDASITGLVNAWNEVEKARTWIEARL